MMTIHNTHLQLYKQEHHFYGENKIDYFNEIWLTFAKETF